MEMRSADSVRSGAFVYVVAMIAFSVLAFAIVILAGGEINSTMLLQSANGSVSQTQEDLDEIEDLLADSTMTNLEKLQRIAEIASSASSRGDARVTFRALVVGRDIYSKIEFDYSASTNLDAANAIVEIDSAHRNVGTYGVDPSMPDMDDDPDLDLP